METNQEATSSNSEPSLSELDRFASHVLATGGAAVYAYSVYGLSSSAGALLMGYATYGAAVPMIGYVGILAAASTLVTYHLRKLDNHPLPQSHAVLQEMSAVVPSLEALEKETVRLQAEISRLKAEVDSMSHSLSTTSELEDTSVAGFSPRI